MNKKNVFVGLYQDGKESLFYIETENGNIYDLKLKRKVVFEELQPKSFIPFNDIIECKSNRKRKIVKVYEKNRMIKVKLSRVYIGKVYYIEKVVNSNYYNPSGNWLDGVSTYEVEKKMLAKNVLLFADTDMIDYADFINLETNQKYSYSWIPKSGDIYVPVNYDNLKPFYSIVPVSKTEMEKGKVLERYRKYKKRLVE